MNSPVFRIKKRTLFIILTATALALGLIFTLTIFPRERSQPQSAEGSSGLVGQPAPDFTLPTLEDTQVSLSQFRGRPVVINFWASWCIPCREEMPELARSYEAHKAEGLMILGINLSYADSLSDIEAFVSEFHVTFPILLDAEGVVAGKLYPMPGIPTSIFINRDGTIARVQVGQMTGQEIDQYVAEILK